jgi:membrane fusion protein (multidrug efflux system)
MRRAIVFFLVLVLLVGLAGGLGYFQFVFKPEMIRNIISKAPPPVATVAVTAAKTEEWPPQLPAIGTFRAFAGIDIAPQIGGVITGLHFDSGQDVDKNAALVEMDDSVEEADLQSNIATLRNADLTLDRQRQLIKGGATSHSTLDSAQATRDQAAAAVARSRALIAQKKLTAPFAGRLGLRKVDLGQYIAPGTSIVTLQQLDPIYVDFPIPEQSFAELKIGEAVEIAVDAWPGRTFHGTIKSIDARVSADTRNILVRAEVENKDKALRPGMFANVNVLAGAPRKVVTLPRTAISYSLYGDSVFIVKPAPAEAGSAQAAPADQPMIAERRVVKVGDTRGDRVAVTEGVSEGDQVVSQGQIKLLPGTRVKVEKNPPPLAPQVPRPKE